MSEAINRLLDHATLDHPPYQQGWSTIFIVDAAHAKDAWMVVQQQSNLFTFDLLWYDTPWQAQMLRGPTWFVLPETAVAGMAAVCHQRPKGFALRCRDPEQALAHARKLLTQKVRDQGPSAFYNPVIWASLAMEVEQNLSCLLGPWDAVYTPAPANKRGTQNWFEWRADTLDSRDGQNPCPWPLSFSDQLVTTFKDVRWLYWLRDNPDHFGAVTDADLPRVLGNLDFLVKHRIGIDSDLLELSSLIVEGVLSQRTELLPILTSPERPHRRVAQLLEALSHD